MITVTRLLLYPALLMWMLAADVRSAAAQAARSSIDLQTLMQDVCKDQVELLKRHDSRLRYQVHRIDHKGTTVRDQIEAHDGNVARLIQHDGKPPTPAEDEGERKRLEALVGSNKLEQREHDEARNRGYGMELLRAMPNAMRFVMAPQQNPVPDVPDKQVVVDFDPKPDFHPENSAQQILPALHGRVWIDLADRKLLRMELRNQTDVNLAWGLLVKVYAGGSITYEQRKFQDVYTFTHIAMHMRVREFMFKTVAMDTETTAVDFQRLARSPSGDDALRILLAETVVTH